MQKQAKAMEKNWKAMQKQAKAMEKKWKSCGKAMEQQWKSNGKQARCSPELQKSKPDAAHVLLNPWSCMEFARKP